jgi:hypothetical protein
LEKTPVPGPYSTIKSLEAKLIRLHTVLTPMLDVGVMEATFLSLMKFFKYVIVSIFSWLLMLNRSFGSVAPGGACHRVYCGSG